ncbi:glycosyltransferase [Candidatus Clostridium stratigraminis]|uniref:Glycosyltransferase n=1 Tax=Candidatus Clostridium stratigraminis TaxID=3381661 RepID=A0ABW8T473_9CLOT
MKYCVLYLPTENVNLVKDMGMIPYKLYKLYNYDAYVISYKNGDYPYLQEEVKGLKMDYVEKKYNNQSLDGMRYLRKNARNIDILQLFSVTLSSVFHTFTYKFFNPQGKVYLKLDCTHQLVKKILELKGIKLFLFNKFLDKVDLISAEQEEIYHELKKIGLFHSKKLINIANGVDYDYLKNNKITYCFEEKENIILNVARIGTEQKNTEMLLEAFKNIKDIAKSGWKLVLVGPIEEKFQAYIQNFYKDNSHLKDIVIFKGNISDRKKLYEEYKKAKIFCLSSRPRFESFGIVYIEAAALGDIIVSTDVGIAKELVSGENGAIVQVEDTKALTIKLEEFINNNNLKEYSKQTYELCRNKFDWEKLVVRLNESIKTLYS